MPIPDVPAMSIDPDRMRFLNTIKQTVEEALGNHDKVLENSNIKDIDLAYLVNNPRRTQKRDQHIQQITDVFESSPRLFIVGKPGSGKTRTLFKLAEALIANALENPTAKIPIPISLSTWNRKYRSFDEWLRKTITGPEGFGPYEAINQLIAEDGLILLLDGFDQIKDSNRKICIEAIRKYVRKFEFPEVVICSRVDQYETYEEEFDKLSNFSLLTIMPLTTEQIDQYLEEKGNLEALRDWLKRIYTTPEVNCTLIEKFLIQSVKEPWPLNMLSQVFSGKTPEAIEEMIKTTVGTNNEPNLYQLFEEHKFRINEDIGKPPAEIKFGMTWLARKTKRAGWEGFSSNALSKEWLDAEPTERLISILQWSIVALVIILTGFTTICGVGHGIYVDKDVKAPLLAELIATAIWLTTLVAFYVAGNRFSESGKIAILLVSGWKRRKVTWINKQDWRLFLPGIFCGISGTAVGAFLAFFLLRVLNFENRLWGGAVAFGISTIVLGLLLALVYYRNSRKSRESFLGLIIMGATAGIIYSFGVQLVARLVNFDNVISASSSFGAGIAAGLAVGFGTALVRALYLVLWQGATFPRDIKNNPKKFPEKIREQKMSESWRNALRFALGASAVGFVGGIAITPLISGFITLASARAASTTWGFPLWLAVALNAWFLFFSYSLLFFGGFAFIEHFLVWHLLNREGDVSMTDFDELIQIGLRLDFINKIGKLYRFRHDTLRDYFAQRSIK